jgi:hypothetical protein
MSRLNDRHFTNELTSLADSKDLGDTIYMFGNPNFPDGDNERFCQKSERACSDN